ncbi:MAG: nitrate ABC transporter substrate-binding protein [Actinophytocola sp.]|uniref:ABC transporter substrate-binding protein n=1 Tax=Actinophytocola sp. TaxID=1872138 RepID=UPI001322DCC5|nr:ABC transporter substrate-binding protein [Actinophytocola sp.]MPZ85202.1 nitrate ABC transporter substrate-binding protein [Actinophytocola sp.]
MARRSMFALLGTALLLAVAGCGGGSEPSGQAGPSLEAPVSIKVGDIQGAPASFIAFGEGKGIFDKHQLDVNLVPQEGGAAIIPNLVSGEMQIGGSNIVSVLLARDAGLPVQIIAPGTSVGADPDKDFSAVIVAKDSPIETPKDLAGRTVAVNTLKNVSEVTLKASLEDTGVDVSSVKLIAMPFPDMPAAVEKHQVDAAFVIEPFATIARSQGARSVIRPYVESMANLAVGTYTATEEYIQQNPAVVEAFQAAVAETAKYITDHPDEYRAALPDITKLAPDLAPTVNIPRWGERVDLGSLRFLGEKMATYGLVEKEPDVEAAVYTAS